MTALFTLFLLLYAISRFNTGVVAGTNRTIDDENGDSVTGVVPTYSPPNKWVQGAQCQGCNINTSDVDIHMAFDQTWHDATYHPGGPDRVISAKFTGTAVYVYFIIANTFIYTTTFTNLTFHIDDEQVGQYDHSQGLFRTLDYNVPVFQRDGMSAQEHSLEIRAGGTQDSLLLFDYIEYTFDDEPVLPPPRSPTATSTTSSSTTQPQQTTSALTSLPTSVPSTAASEDVTSSLSTSTNVSTSERVGSSTSQESTSISSPSSTSSSSLPATSNTPTLSSTPQSAARIPTAAIAGGTAGAIGTLLIVALVLICVRKNARRKRPLTTSESSNTQRSAAVTGNESSVQGSRMNDPQSRPPRPTAGTISSRHRSELVRRIQQLEAETQMVRWRRASEKSAFPDAASDREEMPEGGHGEGSTIFSNDDGRSITGSSATVTSLSAEEVARLRNEIAMLRAELAYTGGLLGAEEALPLYSE